MIKLKSLFRRGQGPSGTKHQPSSSSSSSATPGTGVLASATGAAGGHVAGGGITSIGGTAGGAGGGGGGGGSLSANGGGGLLKSAASVSSLEYSVASKPTQTSRGGGGAGTGPQQRFNGSREKLDHSHLHHHHHHQHHHQQQQQQHHHHPHHPQHSRTASTSQMAQMAQNHHPSGTASSHHLNNFPPGIEERAIDVGSGGLSASMEQLTAINFAGPDQAAAAAAVAVSPSKNSRRVAELQSHLEKLQTENRHLEEKVHEMTSCQEELLLLRDEIVKLKASHEQSNGELHRLLNENESLRDRLKTVVQSPLSDSEKQQLIRNTQRLHSSAPASIALPNNMDADGTPCVTPDWDKQSSSSEIAVACLQDKIIQMEETHYSTNEELQATLQELADLQSQIMELQTDNERLVEEKDVIFQSLCRQTEKLEDSRTQIGTLQKLLLREPSPQDVTPTDREQKLVDLMKSAQDEREGLMLKQEELNGELNELKGILDERTGEVSRARARVSLLESSLDAANAEKEDVNGQLMESKEDASVKLIEISRLTTLLENARAKIDELEQDRAMGDKTDLEELLDAARKEKDQLETQVASLQEQVSISQCEVQKLKDQLARLNEECKVVRNNAKCLISDLEYKIETVAQEKQKIATEFQQLQESVNELQIQNKCLLEDKSQLETLLSETQKHLGETERKLMEKTEELYQESRLRKQEADEWEQFKSDLLMTVRVANDFKTEAQTARENLASDNKALRDKVRALEQQIEQLNKQSLKGMGNANDVQLSYERLNVLKQDLCASTENLNMFDRNVDEFSQRLQLLRKQMSSFSLDRNPLPLRGVRPVASANAQPKANSNIPTTAFLDSDSDAPPPLPKSKPPKMVVRFADDPSSTETSDRHDTSESELNEPELMPTKRKLATPFSDHRQSHPRDTPTPESGSSVSDDLSDEYRLNPPAFRPIAASLSSENLSHSSSFALFKPIPRFASKSTQDLRSAARGDDFDRPMRYHHRGLDSASFGSGLFYSKSTDDLILPDIDRMSQKPSTNLSKFRKFRYERSISGSSLNNLVKMERLELAEKHPGEVSNKHSLKAPEPNPIALKLCRSEGTVLRAETTTTSGTRNETFQRNSVRMQLTTNASESRQPKSEARKPQPLPRTDSEQNLATGQKSTLVYVIDEETNQFVLEDELKKRKHDRMNSRDSKEAITPAPQLPLKTNTKFVLSRKVAASPASESFYENIPQRKSFQEKSSIFMHDKSMLTSKESQNSLITTVQQEMAVRRQQKSAIQRQDSRLSVKSLIESIENSAKQTKLNSESRCSSSSSINSIPADTDPTVPTKHSSISTTNNNTINNNETNSISNNVIKSHVNGNNNDENDVLQMPMQSPAIVQSSLPTKSPLREQQQPTVGSNVNSNSKPIATAGKPQHRPPWRPM
uniref:Uncharacterized protein n=1 Tax=Anopheles atroparvus TaxID=41427 RepID=A0AAG5CYI8_ANOAO